MGCRGKELQKNRWEGEPTKRDETTFRDDEWPHGLQICRNRLYSLNMYNLMYVNYILGWAWWLMPVIPALGEAEV